MRGPRPKQPNERTLARCCVSPSHCLPPNTTMVFMGDSYMRYQYLDLVFTLEHQSLHHESFAAHNPLAGPWSSWTDFYHGITSRLRKQ